MRKPVKVALNFLREIIFGLGDGLVSTLGAITGIAGATYNSPLVIVSGLIIIAVESLSMAAGTYLSSKSELKAEKITRPKHKHTPTSPLGDSLFMGISYILGGMVPLLPYLFLRIEQALIISVVLTATTLFAVGAASGKLTKGNPIRSGLEMMVISLAAAALGYTIGKLASNIFPGIKSF